MADEEVDWGMDEQEDEWRGGGLDDSARIDDDVISLEGGDDDASSTRQPATGLGSKNPPTGPKKGRKGEVPGGPRQGADSQTSRINAQSAAADSEKPSNGEASPLPPGWTAVMSKSHNRYFYFHKESNQTVWDKPAFPAELEPEPRAEPVESGAEVEAATAVPVEQKENKERLVPTGPSASRNIATQPKFTHAPVPATTPANQDAGNQNVANAYARRQTQPPAPQGPGSGLGPGGRNARARSPLRGDRDGDAKRFKQDDGGRRSPPPHQYLISNDSRRTWHFPFPITTAGEGQLLEAWISGLLLGITGILQCR
ncbi:hypothetical protein L198_00475 [Cryptococcus wingfieldii CBS 7118]|uniref:WW domain-containing protein n=1 Tax=Cryptococcus wingfieldii CBS 7118 TaxID=1295528 RepID=A0A1E3K921_9TREE|nr:hypothetical protein L198_00475 [Cryptococcus wingfieldii CBS 7118]ODO08742.1 hypothetical protein L198_00475 [Cryptococcus wingfieldii CBS 7118]